MWKFPTLADDPFQTLRFGHRAADSQRGEDAVTWDQEW